MRPTNRGVRIKPRPEKAPVKRSRAQVVVGWFRDESFYRDITTRALSIAITAFAGFLGAVALGYVARPPDAFWLLVSAGSLFGITYLGAYYFAHVKRWNLAVASLLGGIAVPALIIFLAGPYFDGPLDWGSRWLWLTTLGVSSFTTIGVAVLQRRYGPLTREHLRPTWSKRR